MLETYVKFKKSIENHDREDKIRDNFLDYCKEYDKIRNPSQEHLDRHKKAFMLYIDYMYGDRKNEKRCKTI